MSQKERQKAAHAPLLFGHRDGTLMVGGRSARDLADEFGTPLYVYDSNLIKNRLEEVRAALGSKMLVHFALKANPFPPLVALMNKIVDGMDVASAGELGIALEAGVRADRISMAGPGKGEADHKSALEAGAVINLESAAEYRRLRASAGELGITPRLAIRVNPDFELKSSGLHMGGGAQPFGVDAEEVPGLVRTIRGDGLAVEGLQIFAGSQMLRPEVLAEAHARTVDLALRLTDQSGFRPNFINLGGGWGIPYFPGEVRLDPGPLGKALQEAIAAGCKALPECDFLIELGRFLVGEAGVYLTRVIERKVSRGKTFLITDGGLHHHLAASGNFGQVVRRNYPVAHADQIAGPAEEEVSVTGRLCTPLDLLAQNVSLPRAREGDIVAIFQSGAYGFSASPLGFLSHQEPAQILI